MSLCFQVVVQTPAPTRRNLRGAEEAMAANGGNKPFMLNIRIVGFADEATAITSAAGLKTGLTVDDINTMVPGAQVTTVDVTTTTPKIGYKSYTKPNKHGK